MRTFVFAAALCAVVGCSDDNHRLDALESSNATLTRMRADITTLKAQVSGLPAPVDTKPLTDRLDALEDALKALPAPVDTKALIDRLDALEAKAASTVKVPHLIVDKTGEDLGQLVAGVDVVWSTVLKGEIAVTSRSLLRYDQPSCAGNVFVDSRRIKSLNNTAAGTVYRVTGSAQQVQQESYDDGNGCHDQSLSVVASPVADTKIINLIFPTDQLRLEPR